MSDIALIGIVEPTALEMTHGETAVFAGVINQGGSPLDLAGKRVHFEVRPVPEDTTVPATIAKVSTTSTDLAVDAQVQTVTISGTVTAGDTVTHTINGSVAVLAPGIAQTPAVIASNCAIAINALGEPVTALASGDSLTITADVPGTPFTSTTGVEAAAGGGVPSTTLFATTVETTPNQVRVFIDPIDTETLTPGVYYYDLWVEDLGSGAKFQAIRASQFRIRVRVTIVP